MTDAMRAMDQARRSVASGAEGPLGTGPYLRSFRAQPRRRVDPRAVAILLLAASLLFLKVWERTVASSLSMERDTLAREVRSLENRIRISRDLAEQAAFKNGIDPATLGEHGFQNPDPSQVVDIDLTDGGPGHAAHPGWGARLWRLARRVLPPSWTERVVGIPAATVEARGTR